MKLTLMLLILASFQVSAYADDLAAACRFAHQAEARMVDTVAAAALAKTSGIDLRDVRRQVGALLNEWDANRAAVARADRLCGTKILDLVRVLRKEHSLMRRVTR